MKPFITVSALCLLILGLGACSYIQSEDDCDLPMIDQELSYSLDVAPIIRSTCAIQSCHVAGFENGDFTTFETFKSKIDNGKLEFMISNREMPPANSKGPALMPCDLKTIRTWISQGAPNN